MDPVTYFVIAAALIMLLLGGLRHARLRDTDEAKTLEDSANVPEDNAWPLDDQYTREDRSQRARAERRLERDLGL